MMGLLENIKLTPLYNLILPFYHRKQFYLWILKGKKTQTPHAIKEKVIKEYAQKHHIDTFIETGTYLGTMINSVKYLFKSIYTIELNERLYRHCEKKFAKYKNINVICGDSSIKLPKILKKINTPAIFWLDAHFSSTITAGEKDKVPIFKELKAILNHSITDHIILMDDAYAFKGNNGFPSIAILKQVLKSNSEKWKLRVKYDIIHIYQ